MSAFICFHKSVHILHIASVPSFRNSSVRFQRIITLYIYPYHTCRLMNPLAYLNQCFFFMFMLQYSIVDLINNSNPVSNWSLKNFLISVSSRYFPACTSLKESNGNILWSRIQAITLASFFLPDKTFTFSKHSRYILNTYHIRIINSPEPQTMGRCPLPVGQKTSIFYKERKTVKIIKNKPKACISHYFSPASWFSRISVLIFQIFLSRNHQ